MTLTSKLVAMRKNTSTILAFAIATILTAYVLTLTLSNQVFAQPDQIPPGGGGNGGVTPIGGGGSTSPLNGGNGGTGQVTVIAFGSEALLRQPASNSGGNTAPEELRQPASNSGQLGHTLTKLAGQTTESVLGDVCLSCWGGLAAHETQQAKELAGKLSGHTPGQQGQTTTGTGNLGSTAPIYIYTAPEWRCNRSI